MQWRPYNMKDHIDDCWPEENYQLEFRFPPHPGEWYYLHEDWYHEDGLSQEEMFYRRYHKRDFEGKRNL